SGRGRGESRPAGGGVATPSPTPVGWRLRLARCLWRWLRRSRDAKVRIGTCGCGQVLPSRGDSREHGGRAVGRDPVRHADRAAGTAIFVAASSVECSTFEGTPKGRLHDCAVQGDVQTAPQVTVDGAPVPVTEAETGLLNIVLPADNIFGLPAGTQGYSYGHGWVTLLSPPSS